MKKHVTLLCTVLMSLFLAACASESESQTVSCGHEQYVHLIQCLEASDFDGARRIIDSMEGDVSSATQSTEAQEVPCVVTQPFLQTEELDGQLIELDIRNFMDYFEIREDLIFENPVHCYQNIQLREEYKDRLSDIQNVSVEISFFDARAYGELDYEDQLFFPEYYDMVTGELALRRVEISGNGEGFLTLASYTKGCFHDYMMDIAITDVSGTLVLKADK